MVIGGGIIAQHLKNSECDNNEILIFASGVSNSSETSQSAFVREKNLLREAIVTSNNKNMLLIYFSSCALIDETHLTIPYYQHKNNLERYIYSNANNFIIFRLPQLIGKSENKNTLVNYLVNKIEAEEEFQLWREATRYVIEIEDLKAIMGSLVFDKSIWNTTLDIANPYRYNILEMVSTIEIYLGKNANYTIVDKKDSYILNLEVFLKLCKKYDFHISFGKQYFFEKLEKIIN